MLHMIIRLPFYDSFYSSALNELGEKRNKVILALVKQIKEKKRCICGDDTHIAFAQALMLSSNY